MTRRQHCKGCGEFSEDVGLIYAGKQMGYIEFCKQCVKELREGRLKIARNSDNKLEVIWTSQVEEATA